MNAADRMSEETIAPEEIEDLALLAQSGDRAAFGKLYDACARRIYGYLYRRTFCRSTAEDLSSQTFLKALEKLGTFRPERGNFTGWLYRIARNCLMDYFRSGKRTFTAGDMWDIPSGKDIETDAEHHELREKLNPYLTELNPEQREILFLRVWDGLSHREIAEVLNKSEASCKMSFSRTVSFLREKMPLELFLLLLLFKNIWY